MLKNKLLLALPVGLLLSMTFEIEAIAKQEVNSDQTINAETADQAERALHAANVIRQLLLIRLTQQTPISSVEGCRDYRFLER